MMIKKNCGAFLYLGSFLYSSWVSATSMRLGLQLLSALLTSLGLAGLAAAQINVAAGSRPSAVAINPVTNKIYVANTSSANVTVIDGATNSRTNVATGNSPRAVAINPATNKIYVANNGSNNVTVIDGVTNNVTTVAAGDSPRAVAINPVTNKIYVTNQLSDNVTVIDGATNTTTTLAVGSQPFAVAINPVTNKIYVANRNSANVTVIDGATNSRINVATGTNPTAVAINPETNKIYVANNGSNNVTVIDGATNAATTVAVGIGPIAVAVNPVTNTIYVANQSSNNVTVIFGATNSPTFFAAGGSPSAVAINPVTNTIYVANFNGNVTVIDGETYRVTTVATGSGLSAVAINPVTNKMYVANFNDNNVAVIDGASNTSTTVVAGTRPSAVDINPVTNRIYVTNASSNNVAVIDGVTNLRITTVPTGSGPSALAVNAVTNKIYVVNQNGNSVTVIDGATNTTATVATGSGPRAVAINPVTNKIYVANQTSNNVTVIDGASNTTTTVLGGLGTGPYAIAVNPVTNKFYVANISSRNVTVADESNNSQIVQFVGGAPSAIAVNPVTNKIYVLNQTSNTVTVFDGATSAMTTVETGIRPTAVDINSVTNKIYVANEGSNNVTVIDGATNSFSTVPTGTTPNAVAVNPMTNKIYVTNLNSASVTVIDDTPGFFGLPSGVTTVVAGNGPTAVAVNPVTNKIYVANQSSNNVTVIDPAPSTFAQHSTSVAMSGGNVTSRTNPSLSLTVSGSYSPTDPVIRTVYYRLNDSQGAFTAATGSGPYSAALSGLPLGLNYVSLFAVDAMEGTSISTSGGGFGGTISMIGAPRVFAFTVVSPPVITTASPLASGTVGTAYSQSIASSGGVGASSFSVTSGALPAGLTLSSAGVLSGTPTARIVAAFTVTVTDSSGGSGNRGFALTILQGAQATLSVNAVSTTLLVGGVTTLSPTGGSGTGLVSFASNNANCTIVGSTLTAAAIGSCIVTATKAADANFAVATATLSITINAGALTPQTINFGTSPTIAVGGTGTVTATGGASGSPVTFTSTTLGICTVSGTNGATVTGVSVGTCIIAANQAGSASFSAATRVTQSFSIITASAPSLSGQFYVRSTATARTQKATWTGWTLQFSDAQDPGLLHRPVAIGNFYGDSSLDLVFQNISQGEFGDVKIWNDFSSARETLWRQVKQVWDVQAVGDLDGDGFDDLVWRYMTPGSPDTGVSFIWFTNGSGVTQPRKRGGAPLSWALVGAKDINGDGSADIVYISPENQVRVLMATPLRTCANFSAGAIPAGFTAIKFASFGGSNQGDLLLRNFATGEIRLMNLNAVGLQMPLYAGAADDPIASCTPTTLPVMTSTTAVRSVDPSWQFYASVDLNGDQIDDIVWLLPDGKLTVWLMAPRAVSPIVVSAVGTAPIGFTPIHPFGTGNFALWDPAAQSRLTLLSPANTFSGGADVPLPFPYVASTSVNATAVCTGAGCATLYDVATFKLRATGRSFTVTNLRASSSTVTPVFGGISNGQVIQDGQTVTFKLQSPFTSGATAFITYGFSVLETGQSFEYLVQLRTN